MPANPARQPQAERPAPSPALLEAARALARLAARKQFAADQAAAQADPD